MEILRHFVQGLPLDTSKIAQPRLRRYGLGGFFTQAYNLARSASLSSIVYRFGIWHLGLFLA